MRAAIVIAPRDFRDETASMAKGMFEKWKVEPVIASYTLKDCVGQHGAAYKPGMKAGDVRAGDFDAIFLVDGDGVDSFKLYDQFPLLDIVRSFSSNGKIVAGVNNAVKIIARANIVSGKKVSIPKDAETERLVRLYRGVVSREPMECSTNVMSLNDYSKTEEFVGAILDKLGVR